MASDRTVSSKDVLGAMMELRRLGSRRVLERLEQEEGDLTEFVLEECTAVHHALLETGATSRQVRRLSRRVEALVLTAVMALRSAHLRMWQTDAAGGLLAQMDPTLNQESPPPTFNSAPSHESEHEVEGNGQDQPGKT